MCPNGYRFYRQSSYRVLLERQATGGGEIVRIKANPERIGFVIGSRAQEIWYGPVINGLSWFTGSISPLSTKQPIMPTIEAYGLIITMEWDFLLTDGLGTYLVAELTTPVDFQ